MSKIKFPFKKPQKKINHKNNGNQAPNIKDTPANKEPIDLSKLPNGIYPLAVTGGVFIKDTNFGSIVLVMRSVKPGFENVAISVPISQMKFNTGSSIIIPGIRPPNDILKH